MPNYGTYAICPYFTTEDDTVIKCEGIVALDGIDTRTFMRFRSKKNKEQWRGMYCETYQYLKCPYADILDKQFNEAGNYIGLSRAQI